jgi:hypothetical protein
MCAQNYDGTLYANSIVGDKTTPEPRHVLVAAVGTHVFCSALQVRQGQAVPAPALSGIRLACDSLTSVQA